MKILFISSNFPKDAATSNIYTDLAEELKKSGHEIDVVASEERKYTTKTTLSKERNGLKVLRVRTGNIYSVNYIEKTLTFMTISNDLIRGIKENFSDNKYDLILTSAPPVTFHKVIKWAMKKYNCPSYLMMKDIFPQNGVDIGLYSKKNPIYWYFKYSEKKLYETCSKIGCMSQGNIKYMNEKNNVSIEKLGLFPNTVCIKEKNKLTAKAKEKIRNNYEIKKDDVVAIFGGNLGRPQGLDFLLEVIETYKKNKNVKFLIVGTGTEKRRIFDYIKNNSLNNAITLEYVPREDYEKLLSACDIGLIFLDKRFTIPNFPSKTLSYFECSIPIMAAIDEVTDYGDMLEESKSGFYTIHGDIKSFKNKFNKLIKDNKLRIEMGKNGRKYFEENYDVRKSVEILEDYERRIKNGEERY